MRTSFNYGAVRLCRSTLLASSIGLLTNDATTSLSGIAISEATSIAVDVVRILPMFGDIFWLILLFPVSVNIYKDVCMYSMQTRYEKELQLLAPFVAGLLFATLEHIM